MASKSYVLVVALLFLHILFVFGQPYTALSTSEQTGGQQFTGTLGTPFTVNSAIRVSQLGVFDSGSDGLMSGGTDLFAAIFTAPSTPPGSIVVGPVDFAVPVSSSSSYVFQSVTPVVLAPGNYILAAWGFDSENPNGNTGSGNTAATVASTGGGLITVGSGGQYSTSADTYPTTPDGNSYLAGNFIFSAAGGGCIAQYSNCAGGSVSPIMSSSCSANSVAGSQGQPTATSQYFYVYSTEASDPTSKEYYSVTPGTCTLFSRTGLECTAYTSPPATSTTMRTDAVPSFTCSGGAGCTYPSATQTTGTPITFYTDLGTPSPCDCVPTSSPCTGPTTGTITGTFPAKRNVIDARKVMQQMLIETNKTMLIPAQFWSDLGDL